MAIQEQAYGDSYSAQGYLYDWARRTGNMGSLASYYVECDQDGSTGRPIYRVRDIADQGAASNADAANPTPLDISLPSDATVSAEVKADT